MSQSELSPQTSAMLLLAGLVLVPVTLLIVGLRWPGLFFPVLGLMGSGGAFGAFRFGRRLLDDHRADEPWRRELPPPTLPAPPSPPPPPPSPPPSSSSKRPLTGGPGRCPFDGRPLPGFGADVSDVVVATDRWSCPDCRAEVLAPSLFESLLDRYGLAREVIMGLAELHPTDRLCPCCERRLGSPPLRDARPLVCRGCGAAAFVDGDLTVFRGEDPELSARRGS